jgi:hypothetical protein
VAIQIRVVTALNLAHTEEVEDMLSGMGKNAEEDIVLKDVLNGELCGIPIVNMAFTMQVAAFVHLTVLMVS